MRWSTFRDVVVEILVVLAFVTVVLFIGVPIGWVFVQWVNWWR